MSSPAGIIPTVFHALDECSKHHTLDFIAGRLEVDPKSSTLIAESIYFRSGSEAMEAIPAKLSEMNEALKKFERYGRIDWEFHIHGSPNPSGEKFYKKVFGTTEGNLADPNWQEFLFGKDWNKNT